jgi:hypothetical protein
MKVFIEKLSMVLVPVLPESCPRNTPSMGIKNAGKFFDDPFG